MSRHLRAADLLAYLDDNDAVVDLDAIRLHLRECDECAARLREVEADYAVISNAEMWKDIERASPPDPSRLHAMSVKMQKDARRADEIVRNLLRHHALDTWLERVSQTGNAPAEALVTRIIAEARTRDVEDHNPREALILLDIAEAIATDFSGDEGAKDYALGELCRERANVLMVIGDYPGALKALDRAGACFERGLTASFDLAFVAWGRASVYFEMGEYQKALELVRSVTPVFERFGDDLRVTHTRVLEAGILYEQGDIDAAHALWHSLIDPLLTHNDRMTLARVYANIACCHLQRYELADTESWARRAIAIYEAHGLGPDILRTRWALARVLLRRGDGDAAILELDRVSTEFRRQGLMTHAAEVQLDIVGELIQREDFGRAAAIAHTLVETFAVAQARLSVVRALTMLREAAEGLSATPELIREVRHVLKFPDLPTDFRVE